MYDSKGGMEEGTVNSQSDINWHCSFNMEFIGRLKNMLYPTLH
jgi:hypothetical protein